VSEARIIDGLAGGLAERVRSRIRALDRLDALDEHAAAPTYAERLRSEPGALAELVDAALGEMLAAVADRHAREALRALARGEAAGVPDELRSSGLVVSSWTGERDRAGDAGIALAELLDAVARRAEELVAATVGPARGSAGSR
jgi:hypothetical protein